MAHKHERSRSRRIAIQVLYCSILRDKSPDLLIKDEELDTLEAPIDDYALILINGVVKHKDKIDKRLGGLSKNWTVDRMPFVDLCVLRVAMFEILYVEDVPLSVAIDEAVELAKGFGGEESHKFVNGILGAVADNLEESLE